MAALANRYAYFLKNVVVVVVAVSEKKIPNSSFSVSIM